MDHVAERGGLDEQDVRHGTLCDAARGHDYTRRRGLSPAANTCMHAANNGIFIGSGYFLGRMPDLVELAMTNEFSGPPS
jgi:hypothetical protein